MIKESLMTIQIAHTAQGSWWTEE